MTREDMRKSWEKMFPEVDNEWSYWWIEGDGFCIGIIPGTNLAAAMDLVEDNWEAFERIVAYKAKLADRDIIRRDRNTKVISKRQQSREQLDPVSFRNESKKADV